MKRHEKPVDKNDVLDRKPTREELDLSRLGMQVGGVTIEEFCRGAKERVAKIRAEREEFIAKYGREEGFRRWMEYRNPIPDYDDDIKTTNTSLYHGDFISPMGGPRLHKLEVLLARQAHEVFGEDIDKFFRNGRPYGYVINDPEVIGYLLRWAHRTGRWKELPDVLQQEYHARHGSEGSI